MYVTRFSTLLSCSLQLSKFKVLWTIFLSHLNVSNDPTNSALDSSATLRHTLIRYTLLWYILRNVPVLCVLRYSLLAEIKSINSFSSNISFALLVAKVPNNNRDTNLVNSNINLHLGLSPW